MPALAATPHAGRIVWLGRVASRAAALRSAPAPRLRTTFDGVEGEDHGGRLRPSCSRVTALHPRGTPIANTRQITILSAEELAEIAAAMGVERFDPAWAGATIVLEGLADLTHLPPSSRLQAPSGATLVVDMENRPCHLPAAEIEADAPGAGRAFKTAAQGRRGVTAWVEREGDLALGDALRLFVPDQRAWRGGR